MDVTEQARRSDALYYSANDGINRRWLCDKVASLEATLELCNSDARDHLRDFTAENAKLQFENAKLRELVLYMWDFSCVVPDEPHTSKEELDYSVEVWKRMRELGVD